MWNYLLRRLLIMAPTLFGVTVVSFLIMQLAPGDPLMNQMGGMSSASGQTREAYLIQKRDLHLDKPIVLNFNYFRDYSQDMRIAAHYMSRSPEEIAEELSALAREPRDAKMQARYDFLSRMEIDGFERRLQQPEQYGRLAEAVQAHVQSLFCENEGSYAVPAAIALLESPQSDSQTKIGAIRSLNYMVAEPFIYTYSRRPKASETPLVTSTWKIWWERSRDKFSPLSSERRDALRQSLKKMAAERSRRKLLDEIRNLQRDDLPFFAETLLGKSTLREKVVASLVLQLYAGARLRTDVPIDADPELVDQVSVNWLAHYAARRQTYAPGPLKKLWYIIADTQYAHMIVRLATFDFGRSALKTREPVSEKIWRAVKVSAPLMVLSQMMIYAVAVPLGVICAVNRGRWLDRLISLKLFVLYSVPPFVAAMLFLLFFCYGDYLKWFPMSGLHSEASKNYSWAGYLLDYAWHIVLPVTCLALFSLAGLAMYARSSMLDVIGQDYVRTARAKGVGERTVVLKHALRNALIPIITLFSNFLPAMLGGSVLIEVLFNIPGMGRLSWASIEQKDFPTLMAMIYIDAIVVMISILISDILYVLVDPRISFGGRGDAA